MFKNHRSSGWSSRRAVGISACTSLLRPLVRLPIPTLSRLFATWLVVLIVLPFTAPWGTCDLSESGRSHSSDDGLAKACASADETLTPPLCISQLPPSLGFALLPTIALCDRTDSTAPRQIALRI